MEHQAISVPLPMKIWSNSGSFWRVSLTGGVVDYEEISGLIVSTRILAPTFLVPLEAILSRLGGILVDEECSISPPSNS